MGKYLLGIDNGLSVSKAVVFDIEGNEIGMHSMEAPARTCNGTSLEMDLDKLWKNTALVIGKAISNAGIDAKQILAIGNSANGNGLYFVDSKGRPFCNAILPMDNRASKIVENWKEEGIEQEAFHFTAQSIWNGQPAPILKWLKNNKYDEYRRIGKIVCCKDWLKFKLTGVYSSDYSDMSSAGLMDNINKDFNVKLFDMYGISEVFDSLPKTQKSHEVCGFVTKDAALETGLTVGTPVAAGVFDVDACCIGSGVVEPGIFGIIAGTWSINTAISLEPVKSREIVQSTIFADGVRYLNIDSGATSMVNFNWFLKSICHELFEKGYKECNKIIEKYSADEIRIMYLPYIYSSLKHKNLNASFIGLQAHHSKEDLMRAVCEGIALGHRDNIEALRKSGFENETARFTGGASQSKVWCKIFADVTELTIETIESDQAGALGAAIVAGISAGIYKDYKQAVEKVVKVKNTFVPVDDNTFVYKQKYEIYKKLIETLSECYS